MFPEFKVLKQTSAGILGRVTRTTQGRETWVGDNHICYLRNRDALIKGRWRKVGDDWAFAPENPKNLPAVQARTSWEVLDGYWGARAALVLDPDLKWAEVAFAPSDAPLGTEVVKGGWDHEHCSICWEKIGERGQRSGYKSDSSDWVCADCYRRHVASRSLGFIPPNEAGN